MGWLERAVGDVALIAQMQEIGADLGLGQLIGRAPIVGGKTAHGLDVG